MRGPRERMVVSAALLIRERGAHATAISDVLEHSGAPADRPITTSPAGARNCSARPSTTPASMSPPSSTGADDGLELLDTLIDKYREQLLDSDFRAGCPIVAVAVEAGESEHDRERIGDRARRGGLRPLDRI